MFVLVDLIAVNIAIYVGLAVLPAVVLMRYIYRKDSIVDREPTHLVLKLAFGGVIAALLSMVFELIVQNVLERNAYQLTQTSYIVLTAISVGLIEEGTKFWMLKRRSWRNPNFNYRFDGIVYAVFVSLGFAAFENILYVYRFGLSVVFTRALLAIPAHFGFAVVMGTFYGTAKLYERYGYGVFASGQLWAGYLLATAMHAFYDGTAMLGTTTSTLAFGVFVICSYIGIFMLIKRQAAQDRPL